MYGMYPQPPPIYPFYMPPEYPRKKHGNAALRLAKEIIKREKVERRKKKADEKKKELKNRPFKFSFLETTGLILLGSIPVTLCQLWLLQTINHALSTAFK